MKTTIKITLVLLMGIMSTVSCKKKEMNLPSSYPELSGSYTYSLSESWEDGLYEKFEYDSWDFDDTRKAWNYSKSWSYTESGWYNALKESNSFYIEWKIENNRFYERLWDNDYSTWTSRSFEFISSSSFKLNGKLYKKD